MIATLEPTAPAPALTGDQPTGPAPRRRGRLPRLLSGAVKLFVGVVCCQSALLSLLVVGWTQRRMRGVVCRRWLGHDPYQGQSWRRAAFDCGRRGAMAAANVFLLTLPATGLWYFAWVLGWNISFHKQYEQSHLGISLGLTGVLLFVLAMLYLPSALSRQAVNADWKAFWRIRENAGLARRSACWQAPWAIGFLAAASLTMVLRITPYFYSASEAALAMTNAELAAWANRYYFFIGFLVVPLYVRLWVSAARTYARAIAGVGVDETSRIRLTPLEQQIAASNARPVVAERSGERALAAWLGKQFERFGALAGLAAMAFVWALLALQVFIAQFFYYLPAQGWLNHPLVLLPWMRYLPPGLTP